MFLEEKRSRRYTICSTCPFDFLPSPSHHNELHPKLNATIYMRTYKSWCSQHQSCNYCPTPRQACNCERYSVINLLSILPNWVSAWPWSLIHAVALHVIRLQCLNEYELMAVLICRCMMYKVARVDISFSIRTVPLTA